jgi:hypothetical protein
MLIASLIRCGDARSLSLTKWTSCVHTLIWHLPPSPCMCMHTTLSLPRTLIWQVLHPLKSELNWPLGDKHALDFAPKRWEL